MKVVNAVGIGFFAAGISGFLIGTVIAIGSWSQVWPVDALIVSLIFALVGGIIGYIGHHRRRRAGWVFLNTLSTPTIAFYLSIFILDRIAFVERFTSDVQALTLFGISWLVCSLAFGYVAFLPGFIKGTD